MDIEKCEYIHIKIPKEEALQILSMIEQVDGTMSNLPEWAKNRANNFISHLKSVGV